MLKKSFWVAIAILVVLLLNGCQQEEASLKGGPRVVKTYLIKTANGAESTLSGTVRSRHEVPVAFRINGQIKQRLVDAGQRVKKGTLLFRLDPNDLEKELDARKAEASAAKSALKVAQADVVRGRDLLKKKVTIQHSIPKHRTFSE